MSEAILYAIDAPEISDIEAAAELVEKWQDGTDAATPRIRGFFSQLLQLWPEDGSKGAVWYEDFTHSQPAGPLLVMTFELGGFDEERLAQLRALAAQHGVHVFDPEGEVIYLADGSEATAY